MNEGTVYVIKTTPVLRTRHPKSLPTVQDPQEAQRFYLWFHGSDRLCQLANITSLVTRQIYQVLMGAVALSDVEWEM